MTTTANHSFPSNTASVSWVDSSGNTMIRVYSSDGYNVTETAWDGSAWAATTFKQSGSAVSATAQSRSGTGWIRVYCTFQGHTTEYCCDDGSSWYQGGYPSPGG